MVYVNELSAKVPDFKFLVFDYPVRFSHMIRESLLAVNSELAEAAVGKYAKGMFQSKETTLTIADRIKVPVTGIKFKAMVGVCRL